MDDLLNRLFDGQVLLLFQHLVNDRGLSGDEVRQLRELLDRLEEESR
jgi:BlaI family transcriptional regulator, penicillinase repressor